MEFRLTYDTDLKQVKKILKQIGEEMAADPDYATDMLNRSSPQGVLAPDRESAIVVRAKFASRVTAVGDAAPLVRRRAAERRIAARRLRCTPAFTAPIRP